MKPYNAEIIKLMAEHSDECAAYASAMKWDWTRRQKMEDIDYAILSSDCGFCKRFESGSLINDPKKCMLRKIIGGCCHWQSNSYYYKAHKAYHDED